MEGINVINDACNSALNIPDNGDAKTAMLKAILQLQLNKFNADIDEQKQKPKNKNKKKKRTE